MSTEQAGGPGREQGARYLNQQLERLGFAGRGANAELGRITGIGDSIISKWRRALTVPTYDLLSQFLDGLQPIAERLAVPFDRNEFLSRYGLIRRDKSEGDPVDELFIELIMIDREAGRLDQDRQRVLREHVKLLVQATREALADKQPARVRGRKVS